MYRICNGKFYVTVNTGTGIPAAGRLFMIYFDRDHVFFRSEFQFVLRKHKRKRGITIWMCSQLFTVQINGCIHVNTVKINADRLSLHALIQCKTFAVPSGASKHIAALLLCRCCC